MFALKLTDIVWNTRYGQLERKVDEKIHLLDIREQCTYWHCMRFDHTKHDIEQFAYDLRILGKVIGMSDEQV